jgi:hypothetical protein
MYAGMPQDDDREPGPLIQQLLLEAGARMENASPMFALPLPADRDEQERRIASWSSYPPIWVRSHPQPAPCIAPPAIPADFLRPAPTFHSTSRANEALVPSRIAAGRAGRRPADALGRGFG